MIAQVRHEYMPREIEATPSGDDEGLMAEAAAPPRDDEGLMAEAAAPPQDYDEELISVAGSLSLRL